MIARSKLSSALRILSVGAAVLLFGGCATTATPRVAVAASVSTGGPGAHVNALPGGHRFIVVGGVRYAYHAGVFYRPRGHRWVIVTAPIGARLTALPRGAKIVTVKNRSYRLYRGTYYRWHGAGRVWVVARP